MFSSTPNPPIHSLTITSTFWGNETSSRSAWITSIVSPYPFSAMSSRARVAMPVRSTA